MIYICCIIYFIHSWWLKNSRGSIYTKDIGKQHRSPLGYKSSQGARVLGVQPVPAPQSLLLKHWEAPGSPRLQELAAGAPWWLLQAPVIP